MSLSLGESVWDRGGDSTLGQRAFVITYLGFTLLGLVFTAFAGVIATNVLGVGLSELHITAQNQWIIWVYFGVTFVVSLVGTAIALSSENWFVSLFGYALVAGAFAVLLGPIVSAYDPDIVIKALLTTGGVVLVLGIIGGIIPQSLESWGIYLFGALAILLVGQFLVPIAYALGLPVSDGQLNLLDWIGVVIFSGYVVYDVNRAMRVNYTLDNAVDCALALYLDIINLFIRILELYARSKRSS